jgi:hypothetical protein
MYTKTEESFPLYENVKTRYKQAGLLGSPAVSMAHIPEILP